MNGWTKAKASDSNGSCVEVLRTDGGAIKVRNSRHRDFGAILTFTKAEWAAFLDGARNGEFDQP